MTPRSDLPLTGPVLVTGAAGFIGHHVARRLLDDGVEVCGADSLNGYYDVRLKEARLSVIQGRSGFRFERCNLSHAAATRRLFASARFRTVVHLAAQPGVRYSLVNPRAYVAANLAAFVNVLEGCRERRVEHLVFASSSSVYGGNTKVPFAETDAVDHPVSLYAATKKADERIAHAYAHLFRIPMTGLRLFTVYGPWGRPDMAPMLFTKSILEGSPIQVFNGGRMRRDFTYVDDVVEAVVRVARRPAAPDPLHDAAGPAPDRSDAPYRLYNVGNADPVELLEFIDVLERVIGKPARKVPAAMQPGDVLATSADVSRFERDFGALPHTPLEPGLRAMVEWYRACPFKYFAPPIAPRDVRTSSAARAADRRRAPLRRRAARSAPFPRSPG
jgi:UDP-glucuronate 4-epimerase